MKNGKVFFKLFEVTDWGFLFSISQKSAKLICIIKLLLVQLTGFCENDGFKMTALETQTKTGVCRYVDGHLHKLPSS